MPFVSKKQNAWGHTPAGEKALGGPEKVKEWEGATDYSSLPERSGGDRPMADKWIQGAVRHPGALSAAAKRRGVSKLQEAEKEKHSSNPSIRARGALGARFIKHQV